MAPTGGLMAEDSGAPRVKLSRTINSGSTCTVYEGAHLRTDQRVAVKWVRRSPKSDAMVAREINAMRGLAHPNVARMVDFAVWPTHCQIIMELVDGGDLFDLIVSKKAITEARAMGILAGVLEGLAYLHGRDMVHRDIKLENVCLSPQGVPKLIDFGFASPAHEITQNVPGTTEYICPELLTRRTTKPCLKKADVWACGILLFSLLTARTAYDFPWKRADASDPDFVRFRERDMVESPWGPWQGFSHSARSLLAGLLKIDPAMRLTAREALALIHETWPQAFRPRRSAKCASTTTNTTGPHPQPWLASPAAKLSSLFGGNNNNTSGNGSPTPSPSLSTMSTLSSSSAYSETDSGVGSDSGFGFGFGGGSTTDAASVVSSFSNSSIAQFKCPTSAARTPAQPQRAARKRPAPALETPPPPSAAAAGEPKAVTSQLLAPSPSPTVIRLRLSDSSSELLPPSMATPATVAAAGKRGHPHDDTNTTIAALCHEGRAPKRQKRGGVGGKATTTTTTAPSHTSAEPAGKAHSTRRRGRTAAEEIQSACGVLDSAASAAVLVPKPQPGAVAPALAGPSGRPLRLRAYMGGAPK